MSVGLPLETSFQCSSKKIFQHSFSLVSGFAQKGSCLEKESRLETDLLLRNRSYLTRNKIKEGRVHVKARDRIYQLKFT